jgi:O-methyltransferase involved in polyketide biosynthesis
MYLSDEALGATLGEVAARSAPGSRLAATYLAGAVGRAAIGWLVRALAEPFHRERSTHEIARALERAGFRVLDDTDGVEWAERFAERRLATPLLAAERLVVAEKT